MGNNKPIRYLEIRVMYRNLWVPPNLLNQKQRKGLATRLYDPLSHKVTK